MPTPSSTRWAACWTAFHEHPPRTDLQTDCFVAQLPGLLAELERLGVALFGLTLTPTPDSLAGLEQIASFLWQARASFDEQDRRIDILTTRDRRRRD